MTTNQIVQFYSANGTPFYVRKPSTILKGCLANADIAKEINRYPVLTDGPYRFVDKCMLDNSTVGQLDYIQTRSTSTTLAFQCFVGRYMKQTNGTKIPAINLQWSLELPGSISLQVTL